MNPIWSKIAGVHEGHTQLETFRIAGQSTWSPNQLLAIYFECTVSPSNQLLCVFSSTQIRDADHGDHSCQIHLEAESNQVGKQEILEAYTTPLETLQIAGQSTRGLNWLLSNIFIYTREEGKGVVRGVIQENERRNDRVQEVDGIEVGNRKQNVEIAFPLFWRILL